MSGFCLFFSVTSRVNCNVALQWNMKTYCIKYDIGWAPKNSKALSVKPLRCIYGRGTVNIGLKNKNPDYFGTKPQWVPIAIAHLHRWRPLKNVHILSWLDGMWWIPKARILQWKSRIVSYIVVITIHYANDMLAKPSCYPLFAHRGVCSCAHRAQMQWTLWGPIHSHSCFWFALHLSNGSNCNRCIKGPWYYFHVCVSMQLPGCSVSLFFFLTRTESIAKRTKTVAHTWSLVFPGQWATAIFFTPLVKVSFAEL